MQQKKKVCHITTVHYPFDTRIFHKECKSLLKAGYEVHLIAQHEKNEIIDGISITGIPKAINRKDRMLNLGKIALRKAIEINADVYHFHDPELIPIGLKLKKLGKKVIYDVHEDVPRDILSKEYINDFLKGKIAKIVELYENWAAKKFDVIITATPHIKERFKKLNPNTININNFPMKNELYEPVNWDKRENTVCYIGSISRVRGIVEIVNSLEYLDTVLHLAGPFENETLKKEVMSLKGWKKVKYYGRIDRNGVKKILSKVKVGLVVLYPMPNHIYALPNKMFEYMSAGIPIIASNFPLWKNIVEKNKCGICVDPLKPKEIADAINFLLKNNSISEKYGITGRKLIEEQYNWEKEEKKLIEIYKNLTKSPNV